MTSVTDTKTFSKVLLLQNGLSHGHLSISFPNTFLWLFSKTKQKYYSQEIHKNGKASL